MKIVKPTWKIIRPNTLEMGIQELKYIEYEARRCYKSEDAMTDTSYKTFIKMLRDKQHDAMFRFGVMHVEMLTDRAIANEAVRHSFFAVAQESTRFCNYGKKGGIQTICPDPIKEHPEAFARFIQGRTAEEDEYNYYLSLGFKPEIARCCLPLSLKTEFGWGGNMQAWRYMLKQRSTPNVHPQFLELTLPLLQEIKKVVPILFEDIN